MRRVCGQSEALIDRAARAYVLSRGHSEAVAGSRDESFTAVRTWIGGSSAVIPYFHMVFTLPSPIGDIAYQNKAMIYNLLFKASAETMLTIAADPSISAPASASSPCCTAGDRR